MIVVGLFSLPAAWIRALHLGRRTEKIFLAQTYYIARAFFVLQPYTAIKAFRIMFLDNFLCLTARHTRFYELYAGYSIAVGRAPSSSLVGRVSYLQSRWAPDNVGEICARGRTRWHLCWLGSGILSAIAEAELPLLLIRDQREDLRETHCLQ